MRWFRRHITLGSRLALLALAVQLVLTFGHVHGVSVGAAEQRLASWAGTAASHATKPDHGSNKAADFDCPICALIQLASTSAPSLAPQLPVPETFVVVRAEVADDSAPLAYSRSFFQARAPPSI